MIRSQEERSKTSLSLGFEAPLNLSWSFQTRLELSVANYFLAQLPRTAKLCPGCGENEAVFFQSQQRSAETGMVSSIPLCLLR